MPTEFASLIEWARSLGPAGMLTAYLIYKDLYKPWKAKGGNGKLNGSAYVRESDFAGLAQTLRDHREQYRQDRENDLEQYRSDMEEIRERLLFLERHRP